MLNVVAIILLVGLALPISLLVLALVIDAAVVVWAFFEMWHYSWSRDLRHFNSDKLMGPLARLAHLPHHGHRRA